MRKIGTMLEEAKHLILMGGGQADSAAVEAVAVCIGEICVATQKDTSAKLAERDAKVRGNIEIVLADEEWQIALCSTELLNEVRTLCGGGATD